MELHFFTGKQPGFEQAAAIRQAVFVEEQGFHNEFDETDETCLHCVISDGPQPVATCRRLPRKTEADAGLSAGWPSAFLTADSVREKR